MPRGGSSFFSRTSRRVPRGGSSVFAGGHCLSRPRRERPAGLDRRAPEPRPVTLASLTAALPADWSFYAVGAVATFLMALGKGAFGGGLALLGIPLLALVMDPIQAAIVTALLVAFMDFFALGSFPRTAWSKPDLTWIMPGFLAGLFLGFLTFEWVDRRWVALVIALITLAFTIHHFARRGATAATIRSCRASQPWPARAPASPPMLPMPADRPWRSTCCAAASPRPSSPPPP